MLLCIAEVKKRGERKIGGFRKKIKIPEPDILQCAEYNQIKNKKNICKQKILEESCVKIYEIDYFYEHYEEELIKRDANYILFWIHVHFSDDNLLKKLMKKDILTGSYFWRVKTTSTRKT